MFEFFIDFDMFSLVEVVCNCWLFKNLYLLGTLEFIHFMFMQEKLYQWIVRKHEEGSRITVSDIVTHIQVLLY